LDRALLECQPMTNLELRHLAAALGFAIASASVASAGPIGTVDWNDATFSIEYLRSAGTDLYEFQYKADFTGFVDPGQNDYIIGINFKPADGNLIGYSGTPTTTAFGTWAYQVDSNLNSGGSLQPVCDAPNQNTGNDFFCGGLVIANLTDPLANSTSRDPIYTWNFTLNITGVTDASQLVFSTGIRALFTSGECKVKGGNGPDAGEIDCNTSLASLTTGAGDGGDGDGDGETVPEPGALLLFGAALIGLASRFRRA